MKHWRKLFLILTALSLVAAACGGDDGEGAATTEGSEEATTTEGGGEAFQLDDPFSVIMMVETTGESPSAIPDLADGAQMAIDDLNAAGGIGGHDVEYQRISTPLQAPENAVLEAIGKEPDVLVGLGSVGQVLVSAQRIADAEIPTLYTASADAALTGAANSVAHEWAFVVRPPTRFYARAQVQYVIEQLGITNIGQVCVNVAYGTDTCQFSKEAIEEFGGTLVVEETVEVADTDYTGVAIELRDAGAEAVLGNVYPNGVAALHGAMAANGLEVPQISGSAYSAAKGAITEDLDRLYGVSDCVPSESDPGFASRFEESFGYPASYLAAVTYDAVMFAADAVRAAGSTENTAIRDALANTQYDGVCMDYAHPGNQLLASSLAVTSYMPDGTEVEEQVYSLGNL